MEVFEIDQRRIDDVLLAELADHRSKGLQSQRHDRFLPAVGHRRVDAGLEHVETGPQIGFGVAGIGSAGLREVCERQEGLGPGPIIRARVLDEGFQGLQVCVKGGDQKAGVALGGGFAEHLLIDLGIPADGADRREGSAIRLLGAQHRGEEGHGRVLRTDLPALRDVGQQRQQERRSLIPPVESPLHRLDGQMSVVTPEGGDGLVDIHRDPPRELSALVLKPNRR